MWSVIVSAMFAGMDLWAEPSTVHVSENASRSARALGEGKIYAARGEFEAFQLCVLGTQKGARGVEVEAPAPHETIPPPEIFRVCYAVPAATSARGLSSLKHVPDALATAVPLELNQDEMAIFWVRYHIPRDAKPGVHKSEVTLRSDGKRSQRFPVRLEVFDFEIEHRLPVLLDLDHEIVDEAYSQPADAFWDDLYAQLAVYGVGGGGFTGTGNALRDRLERAAARLPWVDLAPVGREAARLYEQSRRSALSDPVVARTRLALEGLEASRARAAFSVAIPSQRQHWEVTRRQLEALAGIPELTRVLLGPPHAYFEDACSAWAFPMRSYSAELVRRLVQNVSLKPGSPPLQGRAMASSAAEPSLPGDAADGSPWSSWTPAGQGTQHWELQLESAQRLERLVLLWERDSALPDMTIQSARDGYTFEPLTVRWEHQRSGPDHAPPISTGHLVRPLDVFAIRIEFAAAAGVFSLAEVFFNQASVSLAESGQGAVAPWLLVEADSFPSPAVDAHPLELRLAPWVAWHLGLQGIAGLTGIAWPEEWPITPQLIWPHTAPSSAGLMYPGAIGPMPSVRLERLRDGLDDYAYLAAMSDALAMERVRDSSSAAGVLNKVQFGPRPMYAELESMAEYVVASRIAVGRALSDAARKKKK